ncbi:MAG: CDP-glycerol glycerophosphotransferase family protein [Humibacillus sp.]|nr:CDP-glycerol glycerophosphotransferase family protein [Humibacillus sp.]
MLDSVKRVGGLARQGVRRQASKYRLRNRLNSSGLRRGTETNFRCVVYFSDEPVNLYQIRQWYAPFVELSRAHPVVVLSRTPETTLILLDECPLPVLYAPGVADIESFMASHDVGLVLYVNQNLRNFQMIRFARPAHVFVSHGESDKSYMASNQLKAYDRVFVAGRAAMLRLQGALIEYDVEARAVPIGRPQTDVVYETPDLPDDGRATVLYAPTWEGDRPSMHYGSVSSHGQGLVRALLADQRFRLVYRPHPRSGTVDRSYGRDSQGIVGLIEAANRADPSARHLVDLGTDFGWHLARLDTCITDISAVALDWASTGKPLVLTSPSDPRVEARASRLSSVVPSLSVQDCETIVAVLDQAMTRPDPGTAAVVEHYFGDTSPGAATRRFIEACDVLVRQRLGLDG